MTEKGFVVGGNQSRTFWHECDNSPSPKQHHAECEAWWWQRDVVGMFLICRDWGLEGRVDGDTGERPDLLKS